MAGLWAFCYEAPFVGVVQNRATSDESWAVVGRKFDSRPNLWPTAGGSEPESNSESSYSIFRIRRFSVPPKISARRVKFY
jgi:hypothetical protein